jgi:hypothetical protein
MTTMNDVIEQQQARAEAIEEAAGHLLRSDCAVTRSIGEKIATEAALIGEELQAAMDAD